MSPSPNIPGNKVQGGANVGEDPPSLGIRLAVGLVRLIMALFDLVTLPVSAFLQQPWNKRLEMKRPRGHVIDRYVLGR